MRRIVYVLAVFILTPGLSTSAQHLPVIKPEIRGSNEYTKAGQATWQRALDQYAAINSGSLEYTSLSDRDKEMIDSLEMGDGPMTDGVGCSWYCGGGPYKITSSAWLKNQGKITYLPDNVHDFNQFTAWVPDRSDGPIGKKINFHFEPFAPRVNEIIIWNGYIKDADLWKANARVAKFRLIINGKPVAILELEDLNHTQAFKIAPVQSTDSTKDLVLTLEIAAIYKGTKYDDVAVSEINFNGLDVHCFAAGTAITMADNSTRQIETIAEGDWVLTFDNNSNRLIKTQVSALVQAKHSNLVKLTFSDREILVTDDHPFWTAGKQWASVNPDKSNSNYHQETKVMQLGAGDKVFIPSGNVYTKLLGIEKVTKEQLTYTLELAGGNSFLANGLLVKTERPK